MGLKRGQLKDGEEREGAIVEIDEQSLIALMVDFDDPETQFHRIIQKMAQMEDHKPSRPSQRS